MYIRKQPSPSKVSPGAEGSWRELTGDNSITKASIRVTALTILRSLLGFVSYMVIAHYFGASAELDIYLTAAALPVSTLGTLLAVIGYIVIPVLTRHNDDHNKLAMIIGQFLLIVGGLALLIALLGSLLAGQISKLGAPGFSSEKLLLASKLQAVLWVAAGFVGQL